jgi:hypothetical protein
VADIASSQAAIEQRANAEGGHLQEVDGGSITIRIPANRFEAVIAFLERVGEVTARHIKANDVTDELRDLNIRLDNAQHVRERIEALINKTEKIEETIKLEAELERVTQIIELIKGKLLSMQDQIAFSTIRIDLNSVRPQIEPAAALPFAWVKELGDGAVAGVSQPKANADRFWHKNERFTLPPGFIRYYEADRVTEAMSAQEVVIKVRREDNYEGGDLRFWSELVRRAIVDNRAISIQKEMDLTIKDGTAGKWFAGIKDRGGRKQGYCAGIVSTGKFVYTFEAWGDQASIEKESTAIEGAFRTLDVRHW